MLNLDQIESWEYVDEPIVYDIEVQDNHNYFLDVAYNLAIVLLDFYNIFQYLFLYDFYRFQLILIYFFDLLVLHIDEIQFLIIL